MRHTRLFPFHFSLLTLSVLLVSQAAHATTYTWDIDPGTVGVGNGTITGGTGTWNTTNGNWTTDGGANNVAWPGSGTDNDAVFGGAAGTVTISAVTVNDIAVNDNDGYVLSGINLLTFNGTTPTITLNKAATLSAPALGSTLLFAGRLAGSGALTVGSTNNQRWLLNTGTGSNSGFTGDIIINGGGVNTIFEPRGTLTSLTGNSVTLTTSGFLQIVFADASINALNGTAGTVRSNGFDGGPSRTLTVGKDGGTGSFSGTIQDNGLALKITKSGGGTQELSGTNITYTGGTTLNGGTLKLTDTTAFNSNVTMTSGTLQLNRTTGTWTLSKTLNTGAASVLKTGVGTVELTGGGNYSGGTTISAGTLYANAVAPGTGLVTLGDANTGTDNVQFDVRNSGLANAITVANQGTGTATIRYVNAAGGWTQSGGTVTLDRAATMSVPSTTGTIVYSPALAGSGALTMGTTNGERFVLNGNSPTYTGDVTVESGVVFEPRTQLSSSTGNSFTVNGTGILQIAFADSSIGGLNGGGTVRRIDLGGDSGTRTLTIGKGDAPGSFSGTITQASGVLALTKIGSGTQTLGGTSSFTGATSINNGTLSLTGSLTGSSVTTSGTGIMSQTAAGSIAGTGVTFTQGSSGTSTLGGSNSYDGATTVNNGTLIINGSTSNTTTGNTVVNNGELQLGKTGGAFYTSSSVLQIGDGTGSASSAIVTLLASNQTSPTGIDVTIASDGLLNLNGFDESVNNLFDGSPAGGKVDGATSGVPTPTFTVAAGNFSGVITDTAGTLKLVKSTNGSLVLAGANDYAGATDIQDGILAIDLANDRLPTTTTVTLGNGATSGKLRLSKTTGIPVAYNQTLSGLLTSGAGANNRVVGGASGTSILTLDIVGSNTYGGSLGGAQTNENNLALTKTGSGVLTLTGANTYNGTTIINSGTLWLNGTAGFSHSTGTGVYTVNNGGTLKGDGSLVGHAVTFATGSTGAPGNSPGLMPTGAQTWNDNATYQWEVAQAGTAGVDYDSYAVSGLLDFSAVTAGGIDLELIKWFPGGSFTASDSFALWTYTSLSGWGFPAGIGNPSNKFTLTNPGGYIDFSGAIIYSTTGDGGTAGTIYLTGIFSVPEPSTWALGLLGLAGFGLIGWRRKRGSWK